MITKTTPVATAALLAAAAILLSGCSLDVRDDRATPRAGGSDASDRSTAPDGADGADGDESVGGFTTGDCDGRDLDVGAAGQIVVVSGECGDVTVTGDGASVTLDAAGAIDVRADGVTVILGGDIASLSLAGEGSSVTLEGVGAVSVDGSQNVVTATRADAVAIAGDLNTVTWTVGTSTYEDTGATNTIIAP